jgi:hypothetical protein
MDIRCVFKGVDSVYGGHSSAIEGAGAYPAGSGLDVKSGRLPNSHNFGFFANPVRAEIAIVYVIPTITAVVR